MSLDAACDPYMLNASEKSIWLRNMCHCQILGLVQTRTDNYRRGRADTQSSLHQTTIPSPMLLNNKTCYYCLQHKQYQIQLDQMRSHYLQTPRSSLRISKQQRVAESGIVSARQSEPQLIQIYQSLKKNFKAHDFKIFNEVSTSKKRKSVSQKKLAKIKLPKLPRILHGDSKRSNNNSKKSLLSKQLSKTKLINQTIATNQYLAKVFEMPPKKRTNSDFNPISSKMMSVVHLESVARRTAQSQNKRKPIIPKKELIVLSQKMKELNLMKPIKPLSWREINFQFDALEEKEFLNMMRSYNYLKVGPNTQGSYRAYLFGGNNSDIVKKCLKARGCWIILENYDQNAHFVWSQLKNRKYCKKFQSRQINQISTTNFSQQNTSVVLSPTKPQKNNTLVDDFLENRLSDFPLLLNAQASMQRPSFMHYMNKIINLGSRNIAKTSQFYKLSQVLQRKRPKNTMLQFPNPHLNRIHNHVDSASTIGNKKSLFYYMKTFYQSQELDPFDILPETVHISYTGARITQQYLKQQIPFGLPCILKPGQNTNRGNGITIHTDWPSLCNTVTAALRSTGKSTIIIQKYINPFLYKGRKFDIRVWVLWNGRQAWWYRQGYIRTSSKEFNINNPSKFVHLTNDAVQKHSDDYGKYELGNKLSWNQFQRHLDHSGGKYNFWEEIYPRMKKIAADLFKVGNMLIDPKNKMFGYELFGLDFMIDDNFKVWLIEANTNPCLQTSCTLLTRLISNMIENVISITVDPIFPPPQNKRKQHFNFESNFKFDLLYDGYTDSTPNIFVGEKKFETEQDSSEDSDVDLYA